ncbi:MAG: hypothetical protein KME30_31985 [Iphinoe sp. HA4291-MV1]|nr:hypothetical protein [Iphinoe sp. HA4291-MV1]
MGQRNKRRYSNRGRDQINIERMNVYLSGGVCKAFRRKAVHFSIFFLLQSVIFFVYSPAAMAWARRREGLH